MNMYHINWMASSYVEGKNCFHCYEKRGKKHLSNITFYVKNDWNEPSGANGEKSLHSLTQFLRSTFKVNFFPLYSLIIMVMPSLFFLSIVLYE